jgi:hypothetical protein
VVRSCPDHWPICSRVPERCTCKRDVHNNSRPGATAVSAPTQHAWLVKASGSIRHTLRAVEHPDRGQQFRFDKNADPEPAKIAADQSAALDVYQVGFMDSPRRTSCWRLIQAPKALSERAVIEHPNHQRNANTTSLSCCVEA